MDSLTSFSKMVVQLKFSFCFTNESFLSLYSYPPFFREIMIQKTLIVVVIGEFILETSVIDHICDEQLQSLYRIKQNIGRKRTEKKFMVGDHV